MNKYQRFFFVVALIGGLIVYVAGIVLMNPPLQSVLFAKEAVVVTAATVETRPNQPAALPAIDVRSADGDVSLIQGYRWMQPVEAQEVVGGYPVGQSLQAVRHDGQLWRGLSGLRDWILLFVSGFGAFLGLFGLWMVWKVRAR